MAPPRGWYALAFSSELATKKVLSRTLGGDAYVVFRTEGGEAAVMDAYCPHLGAHLGMGGCVEGETLRCPFHGFRFDTGGACVSTAYGLRTPPKARARVLPIREKHGLVLVWFDPRGSAPDFEIPDLDEEGWSPLRSNTFSLVGHPQETSENSVDLGHLTVVHGYDKPTMLREPRANGPLLDVHYSMLRRSGFGPMQIPMYVEFAPRLYGLGYSIVETWIPSLKARTRHWVLSTPSSAGHIDLRVGTSVKELEPVRALRLRAPRQALMRAWRHVANTYFENDIQQDLVFWSNKRYVPRPALAEGDGPIGLYRRWASQFYVDREVVAEAPRAEMQVSQKLA